MNRVLLLAGVLTVFVPTVGRAAAEQQTGQSANQAAMQTCTLKVSGMTCASCDVAVKIAAKTVSGVKTVKVDYPKGKAEVTYDASRTNPPDDCRCDYGALGFQNRADEAGEEVTCQDSALSVQRSGVVLRRARPPCELRQPHDDGIGRGVDDIRVGFKIVGEDGEHQPLAIG
jgi:copper chaperone CopZ